MSPKSIRAYVYNGRSVRGPVSEGGYIPMGVHLYGSLAYNSKEMCKYVDIHVIGSGRCQKTTMVLFL